MWVIPIKKLTKKKLRKYLSNQIELEYEQDKEFQYSNIGAGILGYVLTEVENQSFGQMLQQVILQPLAQWRNGWLPLLNGTGCGAIIFLDELGDIAI